MLVVVWDRNEQLGPVRHVPRGPESHTQMLTPAVQQTQGSNVRDTAADADVDAESDKWWGVLASRQVMPAPGPGRRHSATG